LPHSRCVIHVARANGGHIRNAVLKATLAAALAFALLNDRLIATVAP
jgi:hypothetical protein